jgi:hypothetical protein
LALCAGLLAPVLLHAEIRFDRDVRPIMSETCFRCHGPDRSARMANMRLDVREEALKPAPGGVVPIVPGHPESSAIVQRIFATGARVMPPASIHKELTAAQKDTIRQWVAEGARYEGHWAYQPILRAEAPRSASPSAPVRNPIDAFIQDRLAREGLRPSAEADRRTLIRRVSLDLTGLPPTAEEVAAYLNDPAPGAYERVVDRLLGSARYAEQQTMHWLDVVRYADTCGFHGDNAFPAWPYRDYVLRAFRDNMPFDQFTREQFAGDLLPNPTRDQRVASAYNRLNRTSAEGGIQPKEYLAKYGADRVRTTAAVWMGSSLGCAECHDHKFDPFTARDFYSMKAFFADIKETGLVPDRGPKAWGSQLALPAPGQQKELDELNAQLEGARATWNAVVKNLKHRQAAWEKRLLSSDSAGRSWHVERPISAESAHGAVLKVYRDEPVDFTSYDGTNLTSERKPGDGLVVASGPNPDNETYTVTLKPGAGTWTMLGIEIVQDESLPGIRVARGADRLVLTEVDAETAGAALGFSGAISNLKNPAEEYPAIAAVDGDAHTGWAVATYNETPKIFLALRFAQPLRTGPAAMVTVRLHHDSEIRRAVTGRFRLWLSTGEFPWPDIEKGQNIPDDLRKALETANDKRSDGDKSKIAQVYQWSSPEAAAPMAQLARIEGQAARLAASIPHVVVSEATAPAETRILPRGNWMDDSGAIVEPAIPAFLGKLDTGGRRANRLDLANWLVSPQNPLTARVFVNRLWRQFFGMGVSKVLDDLGSQGEWPIHPELLDWLASEFMRPQFQAEGTHGWDVKHVERLIVTSQTYRQSSLTTPELAERDPDNRLLARQSRFRLDAENVRDVALAVSGLLVEDFGGPSVKPYEPDGYLAALNFPKREYAASRGEDLYRRGVYTFWQRSFLHPSLLAFDAPTREECTINRNNSNTPLQALVLLNDPTYVEASRALAQRMLQSKSAAQDRIAWAFERTVSRQPSAEESRILMDLYRRSSAEFGRSPSSADELVRAGESPLVKGLNPVDLAATTAVARAILNMHETITRN